MADVELENVRKRYGSTEAVCGADIHVEDGEFAVLVGPSGCGKSTLLRMIAGLDAMSGGRIQIGGRDVSGLAPKQRDIAMVFQNYALYPHMTVAENMNFSLRLRGAQKVEMSTAVKEAARILGIEHLLDRFPRQLSGGQRQRVAMGRAIVRNPSVFLFDEPLSNLDAKLRVQMRAELKTLHKRLGATIVYVTHDQVEAMTMADRIIVMRKGSVEQVGSPLELYDSPASLFVATFIGSPEMNIFQGTLSEEGAPRVCLEFGAEFPIPSVPAGWQGRPVLCGVRPEHFVIDATSPLEMAVDVTEPTGSETLIHGRFGGTSVIGVFRERIGPRDPVILVAPDVDKVHFFDPETGLRIA